MKQPAQHKALHILMPIIVIFGVVATMMGIWSTGGSGPYEYLSIRGQTVQIYGKGLYRHMSAQVAPQGIVQDCITLFVGIPVLILSFFASQRGSLKARYILAGTLGYFFVTYLFYTVMGMYNSMYLTWVGLMGACFHAFLIVMYSFDTITLQNAFNPSTAVKPIGTFLIVNAIAITFMWLSIVVPPLLDGSIVPVQVEHYTTLIVQGLDLGILLPGCFISGLLLVKKRVMGFLLAPVYLIFLSLLMTALTAKVIAMQMLGYHVVPAIYIIPLFNRLPFCAASACLKIFRNKSYSEFALGSPSTQILNPGHSF